MQKTIYHGRPRKGQRVYFPSALSISESPETERNPKKKKLVGRIIHVNLKHRHFTVLAEINGGELRETFKF